MAQSMSDNQEARIQEHLQNRPIAPILAYYISHGNGEDSGERNNISVLKFMCVLDYYTEARGLYTKIDQSSHPKLRSQLLQFRDFERFKYYHYRMDRSKIGDRILKCKFCELIGAYAYILTHMTINHNVHTGLKMCAYCNKEELTAHSDDISLGDCYQNYLRRYEIVIDRNVCEIVDEFYRMLRILSKELNIYCRRDHRFAGIGHRRVEKLDRSYGTDFPNEVAVFRQNSNRSIQSRFLEEQFEKVISIQYGGNNASRLFGNSPLGENSSVFTVSSDADDDDRTRNSANHLFEPIPLEQPGNESQYPQETSFPSDEELEIREVMINGLNSIKRERNQPTPSMSTASASARIDWSSLTEEEKFGLSLGQRLAELPDDQERRKLKCAIQEAVLDAEKKSCD